MHRLSIIVVALCLAGSGFSRAMAEDVADFAGQIEPLFAKHCVQCHGADEANGGLRLDRHAGVLAEADSGKRAVVPGDATASELMVRVRSTNEDDRMPPEGDLLADKEIQLLKRWIDSGAVWPKSSVTDPLSKPERDHWAFQPIRAVDVPGVTDSTWARNPIDRFVQARREQAGLPVAGDASPVTRIRRATYSLTGLPPTIAEVDRFTDQVDSLGIDRAMEELVDDLLSRPSYGQRWGRHWMDWVRYADTAGDNSDYPIPQAYLYRNYIIDSLNEDLPYDRFLTEQIAGDLLPASNLEQRNRQTIATGYLAMARRFGSLVERYPWHLTIEDTIDNIGRTMMGMTLSCARCHDHKFDPVSTRDYYGLYGIFQSTRYPFPGIELFKAQRDFVSLLDEAETQQRLSKFQPETDKLVDDLQQHLTRCKQKARENAVREKDCTLAEKRKMRDELDGMLIKARRAGEKLAEHLRKVPVIPTAYAVAESDPSDATIHIKGEPTRPGAVVQRGFPEILGGWKLDETESASTSGRMQLARWITHPENPLTARVIVNRVWQRHFGVGIVPSTSDFGLRGQLPTHPDLLDWLANDLIQHGWSLKHLHRRIMTSRTYSLASRVNTGSADSGSADRGSGFSNSDAAKNQVADPDNRLYWRFNRSRLDAESIRDTVLMITGSLDGTPQTEPYPFPPRDKWSFTQHHPFKDDYPSNKRSVYLMTKRLTAKPYFQTFDGPDPNVCTSKRDQSVTALQALYFVNDEFLHEHSQRFAAELISGPAGIESRIEYAFRSIMARPPTVEETELLAGHLSAARRQLGDRDAAQTEAWASLIRSLFRLNEFLYLD